MLPVGALARRLAACAVAVAIASVSLPAGAQAVDPATRLAARKLAADAIALFDKKEYAAALEKFELADQLVPAPTLGLQAARCLVKLGRLIEASERYLEVTRMKLDRGAPIVHKKAQVEALEERDKLAPLIPTLQIKVEGPRGGGITLLLDTKEIPLALLDQKQPLDPGKHVVEVRRDDARSRREVELHEGESQNVKLKLPPLPLPPPPPPPPTPPLRTVGWIGVGVGAGVLAVGIANGVAAVAEQSSLLEKCPDRRCPPDAHGDADFYDVTRTITTVTLVAGAVVGAAGVTLLILVPSPEAAGPEAQGKAKNFQVNAYLAAGSAGVRGIF